MAKGLEGYGTGVEPQSIGALGAVLAPSVSNMAPSSASVNSVVLSANVTNMGTYAGQTIYLFFAYKYYDGGTPCGVYYSKNYVPITRADTYSLPITNLLPNRTYDYIAVLSTTTTQPINPSGTPGGLDHIVASAEDLYGAHWTNSFTTLKAATVTTGNATGVTTSSATLNGNLTYVGTTSSDAVSFSYGKPTRVKATFVIFDEATWSGSYAVEDVIDAACSFIQINSGFSIDKTIIRNPETFGSGVTDVYWKNFSWVGVPLSSRFVFGLWHRDGGYHTSTEANNFDIWNLQLEDPSCMYASVSYGSALDDVKRLIVHEFSHMVYNWLLALSYPSSSISQPWEEPDDGSDCQIYGACVDCFQWKQFGLGEDQTGTDVNSQKFFFAQLTPEMYVSLGTLSPDLPQPNLQLIPGTPSSRTTIGAFTASIPIQGITVVRAKVVGDLTSYGNYVRIGPPAISNMIPYSFSTTDAILGVDVTDMGGYSKFYIFFAYSHSDAPVVCGTYYSESYAEVTHTGTHYVRITNLQPNRTYYYSAIPCKTPTRPTNPTWYNATYGTPGGWDMIIGYPSGGYDWYKEYPKWSFHTAKAATVTTSATTNITSSSAKLNGNLTYVVTSSPAVVSFSYAKPCSIKVLFTGATEDVISSAISFIQTNSCFNIVRTSISPTITVSLPHIDASRSASTWEAAVDSFNHGIYNRLASLNLASLIQRPYVDPDYGGACNIYGACIDAWVWGYDSQWWWGAEPLKFFFDQLTPEMYAALGTQVNYSATLSMSSPGLFTSSISGLEASSTYVARAKVVGDLTSYGNPVYFTTTAPTELELQLASIKPYFAMVNGYNAITKSYYVPTKLVEGVGYWIAVTADCTLQTPYVSIPLKAGWNLISWLQYSYFNDSANVATQLNSIISQSQLAGVYGWDPVNKAYVCVWPNTASTQLQIGKAYWIAVFNPCSVIYDNFVYPKLEQGWNLMGWRGVSCQPPAVSTLAAYGISSTYAFLNAKLDSVGTPVAIVNLAFQWGLTTAYGKEVTAGNSSILCTFQAILQNLTPKTTYHFRAKGYNTTSGLTTYGSDMQFTTL